MECDKIFQNKTKLKDHISNQHKGDTYECDFCGKCLKTRQSLSKHKKIHVKNNLQNFEKEFSIVIKNEQPIKNESVLSLCNEIIISLKNRVWALLDLLV